MAPRNILEDCGVKVTHCRQVYGGDINRCYKINTADTSYFLKCNDAFHYPLMFEKEARGLAALAKGSAIKVPRVIQQGVVDNDQFLMLEWLDDDKPSPAGWEKFGEALANMHRLSQKHEAGWEENNYIGCLVQQNRPFDQWPVFYGECRILPLVEKLYDEARINKHDVNLAERFCKRVEQFFPEEPMSLLHGDLWSGNKLFTHDSEVAIFDPAVYFGHREMDLGMTRLFGGYDHRFYKAYQAAYPLEENWEERLPLTQLYPVLVHAVIFGGHYIKNGLSIINRFA